MVLYFALWIRIMMEHKPKFAQVNITVDGGIHGMLSAQRLIWMASTIQCINQTKPESFGLTMTNILLSKKWEWCYENHNMIGFLISTYKQSNMIEHAILSQRCFANVIVKWNFIELVLFDVSLLDILGV